MYLRIGRNIFDGTYPGKLLIFPPFSSINQELGTPREKYLENMPCSLSELTFTEMKFLFKYVETSGLDKVSFSIFSQNLHQSAQK